MVLLTLEQLVAIRHRFFPERPGPLVSQHMLVTGMGTALADRWPEPRAVLVETGGNYTVAGDPAALSADELRTLVKGFVDAPSEFAPLLREVAGDLHEWPRLIFVLDGPFERHTPGGAMVRRLLSRDVPALAELHAFSLWITKTWGGPAGLASSGMAWGAFADGRLASVACPFFVGERHEDLGVVTEPEFRGRGLSPACAAAVCEDVRRRGHMPTWTTSPDNSASLRVAAKLGARLVRREVQYVVGIPVPEPARRDSAGAPE